MNKLNFAGFDFGDQVVKISMDAHVLHRQASRKSAAAPMLLASKMVNSRDRQIQLRALQAVQYETGSNWRNAL